MDPNLNEFYIRFISENAINLALDIQNRLHQQFSFDRKRSMINLAAGDEKPQLKLRIGIHYGTCDITFDPIAKGEFISRSLELCRVRTFGNFTDAMHSLQVMTTTEVL